jgi:hypothetical protein
MLAFVHTVVRSLACMACRCPHERSSQDPSGCLEVSIDDSLAQHEQSLCMVSPCSLDNASPMSSQASAYERGRRCQQLKIWPRIQNSHRSERAGQRHSKSRESVLGRLSYSKPLLDKVYSASSLEELAQTPHSERQLAGQQGRLLRRAIMQRAGRACLKGLNRRCKPKR